MAANGGTPARISLISGTKAQFIKMMPIIWELEKREIPHRIIDTGQHESISSDLRREYGARAPDHNLGPRYRNVNTVGRGIAWLASNMYRYALRGARTRERLFGGQKGVALVHGDTASTVLATVIARRAGQKIMHIEAGLRSWSLASPFPEELVRIVVMRMSDYLVAPSAQAYDNLAAMKLKGKAWRVGANTGLDVVAADLSQPADNPAAVDGGYGVVTIHRMETLYNRRRLETVVDAIVKARAKTRVLFVQHAPTARRLKGYGMLEVLENAGVQLLGLVDHRRFVHLLNGAEFVMTDGGSVQEEASYLGVPCLLMRRTTERPDGLGQNVVLSELDPGRMEAFIDDPARYRRPPIDTREVRPSAEIVDILESLVD